MSVPEGVLRARQIEGPELQISITNVASGPLSSCLLHMDVLSQRKEWVEVGAGQLLASGLGIWPDDRYLSRRARSAGDHKK
jgi:hypothetical protein